MTEGTSSLVAAGGRRWALHRWAPPTASPTAAASAPRIVALHGFAGGGRDFGPLVPAIPATWLAPDILGHGESDAPGDPAAYAMSAVAGALAEVIADAVGDGPYVLLGYSMGGRLALSLLAGALVGAPSAWPRPRALVLVGATPGIADPAARAQRRADDEALADAIEARGIGWFAETWAALPILAGKRRIAADARAAMDARRLAQRPQGLAGALRGMGAGAMAPLWAGLAGLDLPTLLVTGDEDPKFSAIAEAAAAALPRAVHARLAGAGHSAHLEAPAAFAARLTGFLGSNL